MKIVYVTATLPFAAGEAFLIPEIKELLRRRCDVRIVPRSPSREVVHGDAAQLLDCTTARTLFCGEVAWAALTEMLLRPGLALRAFALVLGKGGWMTRLRNLAVYPKGLWLGRLARRWRADHIHVHWLSTPATIGMVAGIMSDIPWSCTAHRVDIALNNLPAVKIQYARFIRFISDSGRQMAARLAGNVDLAKMFVLHLGVEIPEIDKISPVASSELTILCPANLYPVKGHKYLIEAMALLRQRSVDCRLLLAGDGGLRKELKAYAAELGLTETVQFLGQRAHTEILDMYREGRVGLVVLPSVDLGNNLHEGIPVALMEAMSYAIPVVATRTGGIPELLDDGAGSLVPDKDPVALADAIERLARDPGFCAEQGRRGRRRICDSFNVQTVVAELMKRIVASTAVAGKAEEQQCAGD